MKLGIAVFFLLWSIVGHSNPLEMNTERVKSRIVFDGEVTRVKVVNGSIFSSFAQVNEEMIPQEELVSESVMQNGAAVPVDDVSLIEDSFCYVAPVGPIAKGQSLIFKTKKRLVVTEPVPEQKITMNSFVMNGETESQGSSSFTVRINCLYMPDNEMTASDVLNQHFKGVFEIQ